MAESEEGDGPAVPEEEEGSGGIFSNKLVLMGGAAGLLLAIGGGAYIFTSEAEPEPVTNRTVEAVDVVEELSRVAYVELPEIIVNLSGNIDQPHYLKLKAKLECKEESVAEQAKLLMPRILDAFQVYLRELRKEDLYGSASVYRLKEELMRRINVAIKPAAIDAILFEEFIIQ